MIDTQFESISLKELNRQDEQQAVNAIRFLSLDMIQKANSGHPGLPLDAAPMAYTLWQKFLNFNNHDPYWINRDRFVLSAGHGSALLYSLLHLNGFKVGIEDLKQFRQLDSLTPGHPEWKHTPGIDATTGPLGQGLAMAVGMAMAEKHLSAIYNRPGFNIFDHDTYVIVGDGDLMEGISQESMAIAGEKRLSKLIVLFDSNDVSLDGPLNLSTNEKIQDRVIGNGWDYQFVADGNNLSDIDEAIREAKKSDKPSFIEIKTIIGYGTPLQGSNKVHGAAIGEENVAKTRDFYHWQYQPFEIPKDVYDLFNDSHKAKDKYYENWQNSFKLYEESFPELAAQLKNDDLSLNTDGLKLAENNDQELATRVSSSEVMQQIADQNATFWGGSADLSSSNKTYLKDKTDFTDLTPQGSNVFYGVREFAMAAITNGILLHGNSRAFSSTFFIFSDYMKPAIRLAALQKLASIFIFSHDSLAVGEDGPTHQPVEQLETLRATPGIDVYRPADQNETLAAWKVIAKTTDRPTALITSRQKLPVLRETKDGPVEKGAYVVSPAQKNLPDTILIATGSELHLALDAKKELAKQGYDLSVVSMPSMEAFARQSRAYQERVLPKRVVNRLSIEMASSLDWGRYTGIFGKNIAVDTFGKSGKANDVIDDYGFNVSNISQVVKEMIDQNKNL
ncbi:transketolase [Oenococcus oeni]|uniref:transketolase n=1 Tax=Oenococcus oeni TaxID=1247 RepID=UPI00050FDDDB|nr:transketolase [Oenococcus oeni]KGH87827.1 transketolase [Oenococcus oeni S12]KGI02497.1 transketolase [Oenococcus oeni IOEB_C52]